MWAIANYDMPTLMHLDHDALPFSPILSCKTKSACWVEHARPLSYVVLFTYGSTLKRVFANILAAFCFEYKRLWTLFSKNFIYILLLSSKSVSVHETHFASTRHNWVITTIAILQSYFYFTHVSYCKLWYASFDASGPWHPPMFSNSVL